MQLTIIKRDRLNLFNLPEKIVGNHWITDFENGKKTNLLNIEAKDNTWQLKSNTDAFVVDNNNQMVPYVTLKEYSFYLIQNNIKNEKFYLYVSPTYDKTFKEYGVEQGKQIKVGSGSTCDVIFKLPGVQGEAFKIYETEGQFFVELIDPNASVYINQRRVHGTCYLDFGDIVYMFGLKLILLHKETGNYLLVNNPNNYLEYSSGYVNIVPVQDEFKDDNKELLDDAVFTPDEFYYRTPYFYNNLQEFNLTIDPPPEKEQSNKLEWIVTVGPMLTMALTSTISLINAIIMHNNGSSTKMEFIYALALAISMLASALLWPTVARLVQRITSKKYESKRQKKYRKYLQEKEKEITDAIEEQRKTLIDNNLSTETCIDVIKKHDVRLWQRRITDDDFLSLPIGLGNIPMVMNIHYPAKKFTLLEDDLFDKAIEMGSKPRTLNDIPIAYSFYTNISTGIISSDNKKRDLINKVILQMITNYSYEEVKLVTLTDVENEGDWDFAKILPHSFSNDKQVRYFASNKEQYSNLIYHLEDIYNYRLEQNEDCKWEPHYVIITDASKSLDGFDLIKKIMSSKQNYGFSIIMLVDKISALPNECTTFIDLDKQPCEIFSKIKNRENQTFEIKDYPIEDMYSLASELANIPLDIKVEANTQLPVSYSFLEMYQVGKIEQLNTEDRWKKNNPSLSLAAPVGVDKAGEIINLDLHEKYHGPHGLIAGTTGSGKSEFIVSFILSLAVNYNPDEVQFVLIDYKGGGLALSFENASLGIKLPHLAGTITNLDKSEINRSIISIEAELKRRQSIFNDAREKLKEGSMNIYKYQQYYRKGMVSEPMSHLFIICDEFAELKQQQPEFMDQLISTSRIGRSLGVHLILATQKPSGVVNDQIWSNSKFKVCLKVQEVGDSNEMLKKPDAAFIKETGRFYLQVGEDAVYMLGQAGWAGAKYYPSEVVKRNVNRMVEYIDNIGRTVLFYEDDNTDQKKVESQGEQLLNVVSYIDSIDKKSNYVKKKLWLDALPVETYIPQIVKKYNHKFQKYDYRIPIGEYDNPAKQEQGLLKVDVKSGNFLIIGQTGSGKEQLLSTMMWSLMTEHTPTEANIYVLDFGAQTMKKFAKFPHVGEVVFDDEPERVLGVLQLIVDEINKRKELFSDYNGSFDLYNANAKKPVPLIALIINGFEVFSEVYGNLSDAFDMILREAPKYGITVMVTTMSGNSLGYRRMEMCKNLIVLNMSDESEYRTITGCPRELIPKNAKGRGICKVGEVYCEFQTSQIAPEDKLNDYVDKMAITLMNYYHTKAKQLLRVPDDVTSEVLSQYITGLDNVPIGYGFYEKDVARYNFLKQKIHLISSKDLEKDVPFLYGLAGVLSKIPNVKVRVVDFSNIYQNPSLDIQFFNDNLDAVTAALEKDVLERTIAQDYAVSIIVGAGKYKKVLSDGGIEVFDSLVSNIPKANKSIYVFVDEYDKLRTLKFEPWYASINTANGIWLSKGFSSQSILTSNEPSVDDKKLDFKGLAYVVNEGKYSVIKTVRDEDDVEEE